MEASGCMFVFIHLRTLQNSYGLADQSMFFMGLGNRISRSQVWTPGKPHSLELLHGHMF